MRILQFSDVKTYEMIYEGLLAAPHLKSAEVRTMSKVLNKLEEIGTPLPPLREGATITFYTLAESGIVALEETEYMLLKKQIEEVAWSPIAARRAEKVFDFIDSAPTKEQYESRKVGILALEQPSESRANNG